MCSSGDDEEFSKTETLEFNGEAERLMRTLVEAARALCYGDNVPAHLWEQVVHCNLTSREGLEGKIPWEIFTKRPKQSLPNFYFGELVTCYVDEKRRQTMAARLVELLGKIQLPSQEARY